MDNKEALKIKKKIRKAADAFISSIGNEEIQKLFREHSFVAGGAIASLMQDKEPNDFDFYFKNVDACYKVATYIRDLMSDKSLMGWNIEVKENGLAMRVPAGIQRVDKDGSKYQPIVATANAFTFTDGVQVVIRYAGSIDKISDNFDFVHCKGVYDYASDELIVSEATEKSIKDKQLVYTGSDYPLASLIRIRKFLARGWKVNAGQMLKIALNLNTLDLFNAAVLKEQLVGVDLLYFEGLLEVLEKVGLDNLELDKSCHMIFNLIDEAFEKEERDEAVEQQENNK